MITMNNIVKRFGTQSVLSDITFEVRNREILGKTLEIKQHIGKGKGGNSYLAKFENRVVEVI